MSAFSLTLAFLLVLLVIFTGPLSILDVLQEEQHELRGVVDIPDCEQCYTDLHSFCHDVCTCDLAVFSGPNQLRRGNMDTLQAGSLLELSATFLLLLASFLGSSFCFETIEGDLPEKNIKVQAICFLISIISVSFLLFVLLHSKLGQRLAESFGMNCKLINLKKDDKVLPDLAECLDEGCISETSPCWMGVQLKGWSMKKMSGNKWRKDESFLDAFSKPTFDHIFEFRRDQVFKQTSTVCPATVNLVSHFASGTYGQPGSMQELQKEGVRLASFKDFPITIPVSAMRLAQAGFHYTGERDVVKCFSCGVTYQGWQMGDRPTVVHARISPNCPFVQGSDTTNLPLPLPVTSRPDFAGARSLDSGYGSHSFGSSSVASSAGMPNSTVNDEVHEDSAPDATTDSLGMPLSGPAALGPLPLTSTASLVAAAASAGPIPSSLATPENSMFSGTPLFGRATPMDGGAPRNQPMPTRRLELGGAVYPLYSQRDARRRSFSTWVEDQGLPAVDELITLGFFYAGYADCVRCFFCGIGLKSWEPGDIPAEVHARWRPTCEYLRLVKGDEFVDQVANGGRNVSSGVNQGQAQDGEAQRSLNPAPRRDAAQDPQANNGPTAPSSNAGQQGSAPSGALVPDIPVVRRARETGYSDQQIAEGIEKLRIIGMERAIEVMLVEVLTNLFRNNPPQPRGNPGNGSQSGNSSQGSSSSPGGNNSSGTGTSGPEAPINGSDLESDGAGPDNEVPDNGQQVGVDGNLRERHNMLQEENARLRNMRTCQRCHDRPVGVIFLPCGHIIACTICAPNIRRCLRCDTVIRATANVFFS